MMLEPHTCQRCLGELMMLPGAQGNWACSHCERFGRLRPARTVTEIASRVLKEGGPYVRYAYNDGTPESGPYRLEYYGYRWGALFLEITPRGDIHLYKRFWQMTPWGLDYFYNYEFVRDRNVITILRNRRSRHHYAQERLRAAGLQVTKHGIVRIPA